MSCFLPTTPNPTSGFLLFFPEKDVIELDMTVEDAAKLVISAGLVYPNAKALRSRSQTPNRSDLSRRPHASRTSHADRRCCFTDLALCRQELLCRRLTRIAATCDHDRIRHHLGCHRKLLHQDVIRNHVHRAPGSSSFVHVPVVQQTLHKINRAQFAQQAGIKADFVDPVLDLLGVCGNPRAQAG